VAKHERSAGFVVYRPGPPRLYLLLDYGRHWDYPKGHIEQGETSMAAALRELNEETGLSEVQVVPGFAQEIGYFFRDRKKGLVRKTVIFFLARTDGSQVKLSDEHTNYAFEPYEQALKRVTFASAREVLKKAEQFLAAAPR
jgi:8-oxo-dGTP pyrophosphatase MutT (NUDIX family)